MRQIILAINALLKFKAYTLINVLGLACSLACVLTVAPIYPPRKYSEPMLSRI